MLAPSVWPVQGHMQVCVVVKAPGAVRGAESLPMYTGCLGQLAARLGQLYAFDP